MIAAESGISRKDQRSNLGIMLMQFQNRTGRAFTVVFPGRINFDSRGLYPKTDRAPRQPPRQPYLLLVS